MPEVEGPRVIKLMTEGHVVWKGRRSRMSNILTLSNEESSSKLRIAPLKGKPLLVSEIS